MGYPLWVMGGPNNASYTNLVWLGWSYQYTKDNQKAIAYSEQALQKKPDGTGAY